MIYMISQHFVILLCINAFFRCHRILVRAAAASLKFLWGIHMDVPFQWHFGILGQKLAFWFLHIIMQLILQTAVLLTLLMTFSNFSLQFATRKEPNTLKITTLPFGWNHVSQSEKLVTFWYTPNWDHWKRGIIGVSVWLLGHLISS